MGTEAVSDERRGFRFSGWVRLALALVVVAIAAFLSWSTGMRSSAAKGSAAWKDRPIPQQKGSQSWYTENLPLWTSKSFTYLNDLPRLTETVRKLVDKHFSGPPFDQESLVRDLACFFHALGGEDSAEYLARIHRLRRLRENAYTVSRLQKYYRSYSGDTLPQDMDASGLMDLVWAADADGGLRPRALAGIASIHIDRSKAVSSVDGDPNRPLLSRIRPAFPTMDGPNTDAWIGLGGHGLPATTRPTRELKDVIAKYGQTLMCQGFFAIRTANGQVVPLGILLFFSPDEGVWQVEGFGYYYYTAHIFWPY